MIALNRIGCVDKFADCRSILKIFRKTLPVVALGFDYYGVHLTPFFINHVKLC